MPNNVEDHRGTEDLFEIIESGSLMLLFIVERLEKKSTL